MSESVDYTSLRCQLKRTIESQDTALWSDVVATVADELELSETVVEDELDAMEQHGFVYCVDEEVRVTP